jgi:hypothetical protein
MPPPFLRYVLSTCVLRSSLSYHHPSFAPRPPLIEGLPAAEAGHSHTLHFRVTSRSKGASRARRGLHGTLRQCLFRLRSHSSPRSVIPTTALVAGRLPKSAHQVSLAILRRVTVGTGLAQRTVRNGPTPARTSSVSLIHRDDPTSTTTRPFGYLPHGWVLVWYLPKFPPQNRDYGAVTTHRGLGTASARPHHVLSYEMRS